MKSNYKQRYTPTVTNGDFRAEMDVVPKLSNMLDFLKNHRL